jgi:hypothetical protein
VTDEELKMMSTPIEFKWTDEESGKSMKEKRVVENRARPVPVV